MFIISKILKKMEERRSFKNQQILIGNSYANAQWELLKSKNKKSRAIIFQTPVHSNIGDQAIAIAQLEFLRKNLPELNIVEVNQAIQKIVIKESKNLICSDDIIFLHGGGNLGNQYMMEEQLRRDVIEAFPNNKIIIFPQTIYYTSDDIGRFEQEKTSDIFAKHKNLTVTAREKVSLNLMKKYFPHNNVIITPDIVLSYSSHIKKNRNGALIVFRDDEEAILNDQDRNKLIHRFESLYTSNVKRTDMHVERRRKVYTSLFRDKVVYSKLEEFASAKIAITDRLHGMVFALLTGTPCIVLANYNQKVMGTYEWIKDYPFIKFVHNVNDALHAIDDLQILIENDYTYDSNKLIESYQSLLDVLNK